MLTVLHDATRDIAALSPGDFYALYTLLHESAARLAPVDAFYVARYDAVRSTLTFYYNFDGDIFDDPVTLPLGNGPTSQVVRTGAPFVLAPETETIQRGGILFGNDERRSRSAVHVPLFASSAGEDSNRSRILGVVSAQSYQEGVYTDDFVTALSLLANAAALRLQEWQSWEVAQKIEAAAAVRVATAEQRLVQASRDTVGALFALGREMEALRPLLPAGDSPLRRAVDAVCRSCHRSQMQAHRAAGEVSIPLSPTLTPSPPPVPTSSQESSGGDALLERLSDRERDIALLAAQGLSNPEIANRLSISRHTVKFHLRSIFAKLEADNRTDLARLLATQVPPAS